MKEIRKSLETFKTGEPKLEPFGDRIIVRRDSRDEQTKGGILLPDTAKPKPQRGTVIAVGPGRLLENGKRIKPEVREGDRVWFATYSGNALVIDGDESDLLFLQEHDLLGREQE
jgi:chaperonin GroES